MDKVTELNIRLANQAKNIYTYHTKYPSKFYPLIQSGKIMSEKINRYNDKIDHFKLVYLCRIYLNSIEQYQFNPSEGVIKESIINADKLKLFFEGEL